MMRKKRSKRAKRELWETNRNTEMQPWDDAMELACHWIGFRYQYFSRGSFIWLVFVLKFCWIENCRRQGASTAVASSQAAARWNRLDSSFQATILSFSKLQVELWRSGREQLVDNTLDIASWNELKSCLRCWMLSIGTLINILNAIERTNFILFMRDSN